MLLGYAYIKPVVVTEYLDKLILPFLPSGMTSIVSLDREVSAPVVSGELGPETNLLGYWKCLDDLVLTAEHAGADSVGTLYAVFGESLETYHQDYMGYSSDVISPPSNAVSRVEGWCVLSWDDCDAMWSFNYSTTDENIAFFKKVIPLVNTKGLLATQENALKLQALVDAKVTEHAPFHVFRVESIQYNRCTTSS